MRRSIYTSFWNRYHISILSGFIADADKSKVYCRPVGVTVLLDGSMLIADDASNVIWRITYGK